ncbi:A disintegrin and metalloproteinase with thrombospondin motifs adt-2-like [Mercenaria mercenaria]|uniref:A disintegrin and metalloproteinase with thrombospondin motifs adt-2-like n=1 Tax=Mercenaria mercenaria TaxID=6596 RepID=UPI00234F494B|nr:A disintegrin and metalloproteinase with thrombospondin motifs adt-2-like [Mercenaria mercenaria]
MGCIYYVLCLIVVHWNTVVYSLDCFSCQQTDDPHTCNATISCPDKQVCFLNEQGGIYSLGCADNQHCGGVGKPGIVGRGIKAQHELVHDFVERQSSTCLECCSTDRCNSDLCKHPTLTQCVDDETVDCAKMNTLFHICQDKQQASLVCPRFCDLCTMVNGNWSLWTTWSNCDVTCGRGVQTRSRSCTNPAPENGGRDCSGNTTETKLCQRDTCPVHGGWSTWSEWGSCSASCDVGMQRRDRSCSNPYPAIGGDHCFGEARDDRICFSSACYDGAWGSWSSWGSCSVTCGVGIRSQTRTCTLPKPSLLGKYCDGTPMQVSICNQQTCPDHKVSFTAYGIKGSTSIVFPHVIENYGNGYDSSTGRFTCKVPGIYNFAVQISKVYGKSNAFECFIYKNSVQEVGAIEGPVGQTYSMSISATFHLNKNDYVYIGGCTGIVDYFTHRKSSFTGFLVTPDN